MLENPSFDEGTHRESGEMGVEYPDAWNIGWLDHANGPRHRPQCVGCLKPEVEVISPAPPYLDPPRIVSSVGKSVKGFKLYGTLCWWMYQQVVAAPGATYRFSAQAHAWAHADGDPDGGHWTHGIGDGPYFALETDAGLTDNEQNYRFRVGIDPFGWDNPWDSRVVWGVGAHIYNVFAHIPPVEVVAQANTITVFIMVDCLWGLLNSDAYVDVASLELVSQPEQPPVDYVVVVDCLPSDATQEEVAYVLQATYHHRRTVAYSKHDTRRLVLPGLEGSKIVLWGDVNNRHEPGTLEFFAPCTVELASFPGEPGQPPSFSPAKVNAHVLAGYPSDLVDAYMGRTADE